MTGYRLPKSHPRYKSLYYRDLLADGVKRGVTSLQGLTAHGRGEAFDYLLEERTCHFAQKATEAAASLFLLSDYPVLSINGNTTMLAAKEFISLAKILGAPIEINLFHFSVKRIKQIAVHLKKLGATKILLPDGGILPKVESARRMISKEGQVKADTVFVPLEDGDRTGALIAMDKRVITVDLNPLSRTARSATITIVDNIVRTMPILIETTDAYKKKSDKWLQAKLDNYDNQLVLSEAILTIRKNLTALSKHSVSYDKINRT